MWKAAQWKEHLKMLEQLKKMVIMLRGEILYTHAPLGEAFGHVGRKSLKKEMDPGYLSFYMNPHWGKRVTGGGP